MRFLLLIIILINCNCINGQNLQLDWAGKIETNSLPHASSMTVDIDNNSLVVGHFNGIVDFDIGNGTQMMSANGESAFVLKLDSNGGFIWSFFLDGMSSCNGVVTDDNGNVYITGYFQSNTDFDPGPSTYTLNTIQFNPNYFIAKYDSSGNFLWAKCPQNNMQSTAHNIDIDIFGEIYITGWYNGGIDFDPGVGVDSSYASNGASFLQKYDSTGNYIYTKEWEWSGNSSINILSMTIDNSDYVYLTGHYRGTMDFDPGIGLSNKTASSSKDVFALKLSYLGNYVWSKGVISSVGNSVGNDIAVDNGQNAYVIGWYEGTIDFDPRATTSILTSNALSRDIFVQQIDVNGDLVSVNSYGDTEMDEGHSIAVDTSGNIYTTGMYRGSVDFDPGTGVKILMAGTGPGRSIYYQKINASDSLIWAGTATGNPLNQSGFVIGPSVLSLAIDRNNCVYSTGGMGFGTVDIDPGPGVVLLNGQGPQGMIFINKFNDWLSIGINEKQHSVEFDIYPNPVLSVLNIHITSNINAVSLVDLYGRSVRQIDSPSRSVDVSDLATGIYFLQIITDDGMFSKRFIKQ